MGDTTATLFAIAITVPLAALVIYFGFRNVFARVRDVKHAIDDEVVRLRGIDARRLSDTEAMVSTADPAAAVSAAPKQRAAKPDPALPAAAVPLPTSPSEMAAYFQETAKKSDDEHKARIRQHVERPVPPITAEGSESVQRAKQARLAIQHVFPPRLPQRSMSYFGGQPIVPQNFDWPMIHNREGLLEWLTFMAQIDCGDLPPGPGRDLLPKDGYLYFFAPMSGSYGEDASHFVTRYVPGRATQKWRESGGGIGGTVMRNDQLPRVWAARGSYDRVEIELGWIEEPSDEEVAERTREGHAHEVAEKIRSEKDDQFFGPIPPADMALSERQAPKDAVWIPYPGFPANWKTARILRDLINAYRHEEVKDVEKRLKELGDVAEDDPEAQRLRALKTELTMFSMKVSKGFSSSLGIDNRAKEFEAPPAEAKQPMLDFLDELRVSGMPVSREQGYRHTQLPLVLNKWIEAAAIHGAEDALCDLEGAALIDEGVVAGLAYRHHARKHHMLGEGEVVQVAADEMKDRYLLLLQLGPDRALDWLVGEMGPLQYWITPEDLAAKRFENTILTIEAY